MDDTLETVNQASYICLKEHHGVIDLLIEKHEKDIDGKDMHPIMFDSVTINNDKFFAEKML